MHTASRRYQEAMGSLTTVMSEAFRGLSSVRLHAAAPAFLERIEGVNGSVFQASRRLALLETVVFPMARFMVNVAQAIVLGYGGLEVIAGRLTAGDIMVFNVYMAGLAFPLAFMGAVLALIERARSAEGRISEILDLPTEDAQSFSIPLVEDAPVLEVRDLSFGYDAGFSLTDCSFTLPDQGSLGICGPVGCGKSLLFDLILRFEQSPPGSIFLKGVDILSLPVRELRGQIGCALQTARLLSDTIRANLRFGLEREVTDDELFHALARAALADDVRAFPAGLDTLTGEKGMRLSGGQRQRLALARLFLRQQSILLLDDVLSAVDQTTEARLVDEIFSASSAVIVVSHRHAALERCDEVLLLQEGKIIDRGSYQALVVRHRKLLVSMEKDKADESE
jgi:ATP-binding cassette subfamily B protein